MSASPNTESSSNPPPISHLLGVDTGGTFTDFVLVDLSTGTVRAHKVLSTPNNPALAIITGIDQLGVSQAVQAGGVQIVHGSTVATNAALERKGVKTAFVTNRGLGDLLTIGRQTRRELYNLQPMPQPPPVPEPLCLEVPCRRSAQGSEIEPLTAEAIDTLKQQLAQLQPQAVAINLLFSYLDSREEQRLADALETEYFVARSSYVLPEPGEYERGMATWLNAYLGPKVQGYLHHLQRSVAPCPLAVMQSNGGTIDAKQAGQRAVNLLLSGPAGGLAATAQLAQQLHQPRMLTFDMGGTSTDVALFDGEIRLTTEGRLGDWPVAVPMVDMHTIGAGGGSLAYVDAGGLLQVGPESAGAQPGPACYGQGGQQATVTDANLVLGHLPSDSKLGGYMALDVAGAEKAVERIATALGLSLPAAAAGIIDLVNEHMTAALRVISVNKGYDPKQFTLCCFGGAGGLHVCALADKLGMTRAVLPNLAGVFSALGMLAAPKVRQLAVSQPGLLQEIQGEQLQHQVDLLSAEASAQLRAEGVDISAINFQTSVDLRYRGQSFTLNVPYSTPTQAEQLFHDLHAKRYGHRLSMAVELVTLRLRATAPAAAAKAGSGATLAAGEAKPDRSGVAAPPPESDGYAVYFRDQLALGQTLRGPALVCESLATLFIAANWGATVDNFGHILLTRS